MAVNAVASRHVHEVIAAAGGEMLLTPVGHAGIKRIMAEQDAVAGVEHSAHYYFRDFFFADSGMLAAPHVLAALAENDGTASALVAEHSPYAGGGEHNFPVDDAVAATARVRAHAESLPAARIDELDGLSVHHWDEHLAPAERWWLSLRSSQTESLLRLNVEAQERTTMEQVLERIRVLVLGEEDEETGPGPAPEVAPARLPAGASGADVPGWVRAARGPPGLRRGAARRRRRPPVRPLRARPRGRGRDPGADRRSRRGAVGRLIRPRRAPPAPRRPAPADAPAPCASASRPVVSARRAPRRGTPPAECPAAGRARHAAAYGASRSRES
ncbi:hypothetical protein [Brachybacterium sp. GPGPB12]|uniref:hypothetical protein n=1 Tax=Brachybacterium sp. GPGPB12 TaxID=3023517 RepID=UPI0031345B84